MALKLFVLLAVCTLTSSVPAPDVNINVNINIGNAGSVSLSNTALPKVVIDTDAGVDDAMAIFMILAAHKRRELEVVGITTVNGLTSLGNFTTNVLRLLETANLMQIPVYSGSWTPLIRPWSWDLGYYPIYNGYNGFGDVPLPTVRGHPQEQPAVAALVEIVKKYEGSVTVLAIGPQTNLAMAMRMDPYFTKRLASLYVVGGNSTEYEPIQECFNADECKNITLCGGFNFYVDAEAAQQVLERVANTGTKIHLVPHNTCIENQIPSDYLLKLRNLSNAEARLITRISGNDPAQEGSWTTYDQLGAAWVIDDIRNKGSLVTTGGTKECYGLVQITDLCRGHMMIENNNTTISNNLIIMEEINVDLYKKYLKTAFGWPLDKNLPELKKN